MLFLGTDFKTAVYEEPKPTNTGGNQGSKSERKDEGEAS